MDPFSQLPNELILDICNRLPNRDLSKLIQTNNTINNVCSEILNERKKICEERRGSKLLTTDDIFNYMFGNRKMVGNREYSILFEVNPSGTSIYGKYLNYLTIGIVEMKFRNDEDRIRIKNLPFPLNKGIEDPIGNFKVFNAWNDQGNPNYFRDPGNSINDIKVYLTKRLNEGASYWTNLNYHRGMPKTIVKTGIEEFELSTYEFLGGQLLSVENLILEDSTIPGLPGPCSYG